jgi:glycosyltransferase involved in cell wall biosynthesis
MRSNKILIISHDAFLNGAPITLLRLMKLLKKDGYCFNTISRQGGPLENDFRELSNEFGIYNKPNAKKLIPKFINKLTNGTNGFDIEPYLYGIDFVLSNTITNGEILAKVRERFDGPVMSYIHELQMGSLFYSTDRSIKSTMEVTDHFLVSSDAVKYNLLNFHNIPENNISGLNYYVPNLPVVAVQEVNDFRNNYAIKSKFIAAAIGVNDWRKGADLFLLVAGLVFKKKPDADIQFVWMGCSKESVETRKMLYDTAKLQLEEKVIIIESSKNYLPIYQCINVLLLPSREDPFPLVVLEAASEKIPTICFDKAGGAPEFVQSDAGAVLPYLDINAMADAILAYYQHKETLTAHSENAFKKVKRLYNNEALIMHQFNDVVKKISL